MTRTDTIAHLDTLVGMLRDVINYDASVRTEAGDPSVSPEELKRIEECTSGLKKLTTKMYETSAVCYRVRDDRRNEGDYEQAEMTFNAYKVASPSWYTPSEVKKEPPEPSGEHELLQEAELPAKKSRKGKRK